ncbi:MAG: Holliday junction resolvase RuvX [Candidatus Omnitrophota bacterium]|nr:Holliday junction resolvase RuvX [Candidatus Omnitrophota bacterium]RKY37006.1 MAG: Holliday junction resolvase RuvX [Candidatus Omnitrophota bacterium]
MDRILALDIGEKRVGVAISDPFRMFAQPLEVLNIRGKADLIGKIGKYITSYNVEKIVIGNPLSKDGSESRFSKKIGEIAKLIFQHYNIPTVLWDERLSSEEAQRYIRESGKKYIKKHIDKVSAQIILQSYLERERNAGSN